MCLIEISSWPNQSVKRISDAIEEFFTDCRFWQICHFAWTIIWTLIFYMNKNIYHQSVPLIYFIWTFIGHTYEESWKELNRYLEVQLVCEFQILVWSSSKNGMLCQLKKATEIANFVIFCEIWGIRIFLEFKPSYEIKWHKVYQYGYQESVFI